MMEQIEKKLVDGNAAKAADRGFRPDLDIIEGAVARNAIEHQKRLKPQIEQLITDKKAATEFI